MEKNEAKKTALYHSLVSCRTECFPAPCTATGCVCVCVRACLYLACLTHKIKEINPENCSSSPDTSTHTHTHAKKDCGEIPTCRTLAHRPTQKPGNAAACTRTCTHICTGRYAQIKNTGVGKRGRGAEATEHTTKSKQTALSYELS